MKSLCAYAKQAGCAECDSIIYARCKKYAKYHMRYLIAELAPFDFKWAKDFDPAKSSPVVIYKGRKLDSIAKLKSAAVNYSLRVNQKVKKLTTSQVLDRVLSSANFEDWRNQSKVWYLELDNLARLKDKRQEVIDIVGQFIDQAVDSGAVVFVHTSYLVEPSVCFEIND